MRAFLVLSLSIVLASVARAEPALEELAPPSPIDPRLSIRRSFGDGVGYLDGYTYLEGFLPLSQQPGSALCFGGARIVNYDASNLWEAQLGGGSRWLLPSFGVVAGVNAFYDGRNSDANWYNQAGLGWEALGPVWQARGNVYLPVGQQNSLLGERSAVVGAQFVRTNIVLDVQRARLMETALGGVDVEAGRELPALIQSLRAMAFVGLYSYGNDAVKTANGVRARLEAWVGESASLHLAVQHDQVFNTTVTGGLALHLGGVRRGARVEDPLAARLGERVVRDPNIVLVQHVVQQKTQEVALDPVTRLPIEVRHAASFAAPGGDGSVERPFQTLAALQAGSGPGQILFAHSGSVFTGPGITLQPGQRFLGEGVPHYFQSAQGVFLLPRASSRPGQPLILNPIGPAVTLASGTEASGLHIRTSDTASQEEIQGRGPALAVLVPGDAIVGKGVTGVNIHRNVLSATGVAVKLEDVSGPVRVADNVITHANQAGIAYTAGGSVRGSLAITGNRIGEVQAEVGGRGIEVDLHGSATVRGIIAGNDLAALNGLSARGISLSSAGSGSLTAQVVNNALAGAGSPGPLAGLSAASSGNGFLGLQLAGNSSVAPYQLFQSGASVFQSEALLATNKGPISPFVGSILTVPAGTFGFPAP
jgi:hypothetical protein